MQRAEIPSVDGGQGNRIERHEDVREFSTLVAFGGTGGTAAAYVEAHIREGRGSVIVVTHQPDTSTFDPLIGHLKFRRLDTSSISLERAHLEDPSSVSAMFDRLEGNNIFAGNLDVVVAPAGGVPRPLEFVAQLDEMLEIHESDDPDKEQRINDAIDELNDKIELWLPENHDEVYALNVEGPQRAVEMLAKRNQERFQRDGSRIRVAYINSTFGHTGEGPHFYGGPDPRINKPVPLRGVLLKHLFQEWMFQNGKSLADRGVDIGEIVAPVISDTNVGRIILRRMVPFYPEDIQQGIKDTAVKRVDVAVALGDFFSAPDAVLAAQACPFLRYVSTQDGHREISSTMAANLRLDVSRARF